MISSVLYWLGQLLLLLWNCGMLLWGLPRVGAGAVLAAWAGLRLWSAPPPVPGQQQLCKRLLAPGRSWAHRGASMDAPENTKAALNYCLQKGCPNVEVDLRMTRDGKMILAHDPIIAGKVIADTDWEDLKQFDVEPDHPSKHKFGVTPLYPFDEALDHIATTGMCAVLDIKDGRPGALAAVVEAFKASPGMHNTCIVTSFNPLYIYKIRKADPDIMGALSFRPHCFSALSYCPEGTALKMYRNSRLKHWGARILDELHYLVWRSGILVTWTGSTALFIHKDIVSLESAESWRKAGCSVCLWSVNMPQEKQNCRKYLKCAYLTDTFIGESN